MSGKILIVDDEKSVRTFLKELLEQEGYEISVAANVDETFKIFSDFVPNLVILDLGLPDGSGLDIIPGLKKLDKSVEIIVITAMGTVDNAVESMKLGAFDFITKPFDVENMLIVIKRALKFVNISLENSALKNLHKNKIYYEEFIGESPEIKTLKGLINKLAFVDVPILITGDTGTGKNILAKQIHFTFSENNDPLVYTNCSSIPETLFESELFGHEKGSFTGAGALKKGRVEEADGGTLILDEITEIPYDLQAKLLNFIQEKSFYRVGGNRHIKVSTRIIALSNRDLLAEVKGGRFRKDLYYRLNVIHMQIPSLNERGKDILLLAEYFIDVLKKKYGKEKELTEKCRQTLQNYSWPGNVRELKNALERVFIFSENDLIEGKEINFDSHEEIPESGDLKSIVNNFEQKIILRTLTENSGNRTKTAEQLGVSLRNLHYKLNKYDYME